ncbi:MAG: NAD(P)H-dependent oxidoreductase subunit E [Candidatus Aminicenantes bacterium]|nr:MAG: NAD(P)H-dependent oxidoreductase subunit E [Candidatus Aminicenantes bacterium]
MSYAPSPAALARIEAAIARYPEKSAAVLPVLHVIQDESGFVSPDAEVWVAAKLSVAPVRVREVLSFYTMFRRTPAGRSTLQVCHNVSCALAGAEDILRFISEKLGIAPGQTTPDGAISLVTVECLGNCDHAPCLQVDGVDHGPASRETVDALIEELKSHA